MKKLIFSAIVCVLACVMVACSSGNSPKAAVTKYADATIKGDYKAALDQVYFKGTPEEVAKTREQYLSLLQEKTKEGVKDSDKMTSFTIDDEQIDEANGTAVVTITMTYADGHTKTDNIKTVKDDNGNWMVDSNK